MAHITYSNIKAQFDTAEEAYQDAVSRIPFKKYTIIHSSVGPYECEHCGDKHYESTIVVEQDTATLFTEFGDLIHDTLQRLKPIPNY